MLLQGLKFGMTTLVSAWQAKIRPEKCQKKNADRSNKNWRNFLKAVVNHKFLNSEQQIGTLHWRLSRQT